LIRAGGDFSLEAFDRGKFAEYEKIANDLIARKSPVNFYLVSRKEAEEKLSRLTTLAKGFSDDKGSPHGRNRRNNNRSMWGTHVKNTGEIKGIKITKLQNKGKSNRRMYFTIG
jgi:misacylated tRNA(Ala) deacylase